MEEFAKDTDGFLARHFDRKISGVISRQLIKTPITPNQITIVVTIIGVFAGWCMAQGTDRYRIIGSLVFLLTSILDGCDGEVARAKHMTSKLGGWLDLWGDNIVHIAVFYGIGLGYFRELGNPQFETLGFVAAMGTLLSASLASYQTYLKSRGNFQQGSLFKSVSGDLEYVEGPESRKRLIWLADALARRDFIYAVVVLAFFGKLIWFLWASAVGVVIYTLVLIFLLF